MPHCQQSSTQPCSARTPASCPAPGGSPLCLAHRPFPSIIIATCFGISSRLSPAGSSSSAAAGGAPVAVFSLLSSSLATTSAAAAAPARAATRSLSAEGLEKRRGGWVVALAACVCWITCAVALMLEQRVQSRTDGRRLIWLLAAGFSIGSGIWSTHFIGMLGYDPGVILGYEPRATDRKSVV